jgi:hypothetical protein
MLILAKSNQEKPTSLAAQKDYIYGHLAATTEAGPFMALGGYLDSKGQVAPLLSHPALFAQVGWPGTGPLPPKQ